MTLYVACNNEVTADITPRRSRHFRPKPGQTFRWTNTALAEGKKTWALRKIWQKYPTRRQIQSGTATADRHGLVTLKGVTILPTKNRIVICREGNRP